MKITAAAVVATALLYGCGGSGGGENFDFLPAPIFKHLDRKRDQLSDTPLTGRNRLLWCR